MDEIAIDPPAPPRLKIEVKPRAKQGLADGRPQEGVDRTTRHEDAFDYWTERTQRGTSTPASRGTPSPTT